MKTTSKAHINQQERNIGVDVGKTFLDIYILELDRHWQIHNVTSEIKTLITTLNRFNLTRIVVEATGGYERNLVNISGNYETPSRVNKYTANRDNSFFVISMLPVAQTP